MATDLKEASIKFPDFRRAVEAFIVTCGRHPVYLQQPLICVMMKSLPAAD